MESDYLTRLAHFTASGASLSHLTRAVVDARNDGHAWEAIADALGQDPAEVEQTYRGAHLLAMAVARTELVTRDINDIRGGWSSGAEQTISELVNEGRLDQTSAHHIDELYLFYTRVMEEPEDVSDAELDVITSRAIPVLARLVTLRYEALESMSASS